MSHLPSTVVINEDGPREGFQMESAAIPTANKIALIDALAATGIREIQIASFVSPRKVPSMADAEAVVAGVRPREGVAFTGLYLNEQGLRRALATGRLHIEGGISLCASAAFLRRNQNATPASQREARRAMIGVFQEAGVQILRGSVSAAFGCNFEGDIPLERLLATVRAVFAIAEEFDIELEELGLSDTMAWANPQQIRRTIGALRDAYPEIRLCLHLHDTRGLALANALAGLEMGVRHFDSSVGGLGGCPFAAHKGAAGNLCTEDFVLMCEEMGVRTGIDLDRLVEAALLAERIVGHPLPGSVMRGGSLSALRRRAAGAA
ncbi:hydroxymethylglutaryl-CoA lyase [Ancylobacter terrae]|uniref:hydroxymethylglutaryl-CoA lyase n=1 Tax=Ancylobacter sp. sgz301288 TaxID=3342077 RepID=UPI00385D2970